MQPNTIAPDAWVQNTALSMRGIALEALQLAHEEGLRQAAADGQLWKLRITSVPEPENTRAYIEAAHSMTDRFAYAVIDQASGKVLGSTSYHDIVPKIKRIEIGYTWYAASTQRSPVNTICKLLLLTHAFEVLKANVVGWRTDNFNFRSQAAIERLGAKKDGIIRGHGIRRDGTIRDTVMYSMTAGEWPECKAQLLYLLDKPR